jgi:hypothetical protein
MKYLEELDIGDSYSYNNNSFIITADYKKDGSRLCICLKNGLPQWVTSNTIVEPIDIFILDQQSNIIAIRERKKQDDIQQNKNIY